VETASREGKEEDYHMSSKRTKAMWGVNERGGIEKEEPKKWEKR